MIYKHKPTTHTFIQEKADFQLEHLHSSQCLHLTVFHNHLVNTRLFLNKCI